jgi:hypothetical protein
MRSKTCCSMAELRGLHAPLGSATGNALSGRFGLGSRSKKLGRTVRKRPVASNSIWALNDNVATVRRGGSCPFARKACATSESKNCQVDEKKPSDGQSFHGSFAGSASVSLHRRVHRFFADVITAKESPESSIAVWM